MIISAFTYIIFSILLSKTFISIFSK
jgi:hypothetical protein